MGQLRLYIETRNYKCTSKGVFQRIVDEDNSGESWQLISRPIYISKIHRKLESGELFWTVRFQCNDGWQEDTISRMDATERDFSVLLRKGADVTTWKTKRIINYLVESEKQVKFDFQHSHIGWNTYENINYYSHNSLVSGASKIKSEYIGELNLSKCGSFNNWLKIIKNHVVGHTELELALCVGFSAVLVGYINRVLNLHIDSLIFHLSGNSTTGKTSAATVAVSGFGDPKEGARSLIQSFNGTDNALTNLMANNNGVPIVCDETSLSIMGNQKLVNVLYTWAKNISKSRLDKNSVPKPRSEWATTIITTGEGSLLDQINQNEGIRVRLFEFKNIQWTKSAAHSNALVKGLSKNYGHGVEPFVQTVLSYLPKEIQIRWDTETEVMEKALPHSKFYNRIGKKFALIIMTAQLLNQAFDLKLDIDGIRTLLIQQETVSIEEREIGPKALELIREWLLMNQKHFYINKNDVVDTQTIWGRMNIDKSKQVTEVFILPSVFNQMLEEKGFTDRSVVLRELDSLNVLIKEKDANQNKYSIRRVIKGIEASKNGVQTYGIRFEGAFIYLDEPRKLKSRRQPSNFSGLIQYEDVDIDEM